MPLLPRAREALQATLRLFLRSMPSLACCMLNMLMSCETSSHLFAEKADFKRTLPATGSFTKPKHLSCQPLNMQDLMGKFKCKCIGIAGLHGKLAVNISKQLQPSCQFHQECKFLHLASERIQTWKAWQPCYLKPRSHYPADLGSSCNAWDDRRHPDCRSDEPPGWRHEVRSDKVHAASGVCCVAHAHQVPPPVVLRGPLWLQH